MDIQIIIGLILTILPITELRGGLPVIVEYALRNNVSVWPYFILVLILNIFVIFFIFFFLDFLHKYFMKIETYRRVMDKIMKRVERKSVALEKKTGILQYLLLAFFVAIPLPGTGAWTGTLLAWFLGMSRKKSFLAIALGVIVAGVIILFGSLGVFGFLLG